MSTVPESAVPTAQLIAAMLEQREGVSDLIFSPGKPPQVEAKGELIPLPFRGFEKLAAHHTMRIAEDLIAGNNVAATQLSQTGSADLSYALDTTARFRVNIFRQRATCAIVMRVIPISIPTFEDLGLPEALADIVPLRNGIVLVTGPTGSGKSSTLAAIVDRMNRERAIHILTIEDPIEFIHQHKKATIHQRELHSDTPTFSLALRAALRQAPKVILVGEMRDRETIEIALGPPRPGTSSCPPCIRSTPPRPSSASSARSRRASRGRFGRVCRRPSSTSFPSVSCPEPTDAAASPPSRSSRRRSAPGSTSSRAK